VRFDHDHIVWTGKLQPTPASITYTVRVIHRMGQVPRVIVLDPPLKRRPNEALPHVYPGDGLCLYHGDEFNDSKDFIAHTIVPWASEWLLHYEFWLATGEWHGGGIHPTAPDDKACLSRTNPKNTRG